MAYKIKPWREMQEIFVIEHNRINVWANELFKHGLKIKKIK